MTETKTKSAGMAAAKKGVQTRVKKSNSNEVQAEELSPAETGKIDLHLKSSDNVEVIIKNEVAKLNDGFSVVVFDPEQNKLSPRAKIAILKEMYQDLKIIDENDKEGYEKADKARKMLVKLRTGVEAKYKLLSGNYVKVTKALSTERNELTKLIEEIEDSLEVKLDAINQIKAEKELEEERIKQEKLKKRVDELKAAGLGFDPVSGYYTIGEVISFDIITIQNFDAAQYEVVLNKVKIEKAKFDFFEKKRLQKDRVEKYLFERQKRKQKEEAEKLELAAKKQKDERTADRIYLLEALGMVSNKSNAYVYNNSAGIYTVSKAFIENSEGEDWRNIFSSAKEAIKTLKEDADLAIKKEARRKRMFAAGYTLFMVKGQFCVQDEFGLSNCIDINDVYSVSDEQFEINIENYRKNAADTLNLAKETKAQKEAAENQFKQRSLELQGLGFTPYSEGFKKVVTDVEEPEFTDVFFATEVLNSEVKEYDKKQWSECIANLISDNSKIGNIKKQIKERKDQEAETARKALLSEQQLVTEYLLKVDAIEAPTVQDAVLKDIVVTIRKAIANGLDISPLKKS